ncbi:ATP-dependent RNA helicase DRS1 [Fulvia fulva]|nr:ATP-dependent RNA helicase DRS1 [Fulvia fulva]KAK4632755.1 ATP-dependent RNA helicase DRS1 [Fulvia fulva]WPV10923.1 ATP-dependent RNA helicase DRS1 [Fulvia fulva]WPV25657.1 ATP-dependent RNA helicase DRS1 [Fulvia fulva]
MSIDDLIGTLSDGDISDEESGEEEVVAPVSNKRKRDTKAQTAVKKQKQDKDEELESDFEFENEAGAVALDLDTWGGGVQDDYDSIEALVARRRPKKEAQETVSHNEDEDEEEDGEDQVGSDDESGDEDLHMNGDHASEEDEEEFHTAIDDTMEDDEDESNSEGAEPGAEEEEVEAAPPVAHPDDEEADSASEAGEDAAEREKANAFFADGESKKSGPTATAFHAMNLSRPILKGLASVGFDKPTPIQMKAVPVALEGKDLVGGAVTGSGKTAAFLIPILERLLFRPKRTATTRVAILMPTRELALQCFNVAKKLAAFTDITVAMAVGGLSIKEQDKELKMRPDIVIATPGRFIDLERNYRSLDVSTIEILVLDEADRMLEEGFADELNEILTKIPKSRQTMLFSATMTTKVDDLVRSGLQRPVRLMVDAQKQTVSGLTQEFVRLRPGREQKRLGYLMYLCEKVYTDRVIIFFRQKKEAHRVRVIFALCGLKAAELHGSMSQEQRINSIEAFRTGKASYLLATDLASRGLDIKGIDTVINYEAPQSHEIYLHRVGRTARAGRSGCACTLAAEPDRKVVKAAVKTGKAQGAIIKQRTIEAHDVDAWDARLNALEQDVEDVMREEKEERALSQADRDLTRADNIAKYEDEIMSRPKKTWFEGEKDKQAAKEEGKAILNGEPVVKAEKKKGKLSNKEKKRLQDKDDRKDGSQWMKSKKATVVGKARDEKGREKQAKHKSKPKGGKPKPKAKK